MNMFSNLKNFLYDSENFITLYDNKIYLYNIIRIDSLTSTYVSIYFNNKKVVIKGIDLKPIKLLKKEILLSGVIESVTIDEK